MKDISRKHQNENERKKKTSNNKKKIWKNITKEGIENHRSTRIMKQLEHLSILFWCATMV